MCFQGCTVYSSIEIVVVIFSYNTICYILCDSVSNVWFFFFSFLVKTFVNIRFCLAGLVRISCVPHEAFSNFEELSINTTNWESWNLMKPLALQKKQITSSVKYFSSLKVRNKVQKCTDWSFQDHEKYFQFQG